MAGIFGMLNLSDVSADQVFVNTVGQQLVYTATQRYLERVNADMNAALSVFVERTTTGYSERYKLPGGGRLQRRGGAAQSGAVKAANAWDIGLPLEDFGAQVAATDVALAYMSIAEYDRHLDTVRIQNANTVRFEILKALFNNTARTFIDPTLTTPTITVQPLANADTVVYPAVLGSETEATDDHYLESNYATADISNTNNPIPVMVAELTEHFGDMTGGSNIVVFVPVAVSAELQVLTSFTPVSDSFIQVGDNTDVPTRLPNVPGKIVGRMDGAWISEWRWIPANYAVAIHLEEPAPLLMRVDPTYTGLGSGLQLVATDFEYPIASSHWRHRFGVGAGNRLNGVVMEFGTGGTYSIPAAYA